MISNEDKIVCFQCQEGPMILTTPREMLQHQHHGIKRSLAEILQDLNENAQIEQEFQPQNQLDSIMTHIDKSLKDLIVHINSFFEIKRRFKLLSSFLRQIKDRLMQDLEKREIITLILNNEFDNRNLKGDLKFLLDIKELKKDSIQLQDTEKLILNDIDTQFSDAYQFFPIIKRVMLTLPDGAVYEGDHLNGQKTGIGKQIWPNCNVYEGDWFNHKRTGKGEFTWLSGNVYKGDWLNDQRTGKGKFTWPNGDVYEGDWLNDQKTGRGKFTWPDGNVYEGHWLNDQQTGIGEYTWPSGKVYEGDWLDDRMTGKGKLTWPNGNVYEGDWLNDHKTGKGKQTWPSGLVYEGDWLNEQRSGKGKQKWPSGKVYEGDWLDGNIYEGDWLYDQRTGKGELTYLNGDKQVGLWKNGVYKGQN